MRACQDHLWASIMNVAQPNAFAAPHRSPKYSFGTDRSAAPGVPAELRDQAIPVATVERSNVFDDLSGPGVSRPLEQERRRVQRDAERRRLVLVRHRRLERLPAAHDVDASRIPKAPLPLPMQFKRTELKPYRAARSLREVCRPYSPTQDE